MLCSVFLFTGCWTTSEDSQYTGYVTGVTQYGIFWKTGKVWSKTDIESSQEYIYCVEDEEVYQQLKDLEANKEVATMILHSELFTAPWRCGLETWIIDSIITE